MFRVLAAVALIAGVLGATPPTAVDLAFALNGSGLKLTSDAHELVGSAGVTLTKALCP